MPPTILMTASTKPLRSNSLELTAKAFPLKKSCIKSIFMAKKHRLWAKMGESEGEYERFLAFRCISRKR